MQLLESTSMSQISVSSELSSLSSRPSKPRELRPSSSSFVLSRSPLENILPADFFFLPGCWTRSFRALDRRQRCESFLLLSLVRRDSHPSSLVRFHRTPSFNSSIPERLEESSSPSCLLVSKTSRERCRSPFLEVSLKTRSPVSSSRRPKLIL